MAIDTEVYSIMAIDTEVFCPVSSLSPRLKEQILRDIHSLVSVNCDDSFTGRAIARIFHGIGSPRFPALVWGRQHRYWRRYLHADFVELCQSGTRKLLELQ